MSTFTIKIDTGNAAFDDADKGPEIARILRGIATEAWHEGAMIDGYYRALYDINGNRVGTAQITND